MSKQKGKDKNKNADSQLQQLVEQQKRQILQQSFTIKKLQDRLSRLTQQNFQIVSTKDNFQASYQQKVDKQRIIIETHEHTIKDKSNKIYQLELEKINLTNRVKSLERDIKESQALRLRQMDQFKRMTQNQITKLQTQLKEYNTYMNQRDLMENQNNSLKKTLEEEVQNKIREVADKEREKVQATDKLRDEMLTKIRDMRSNLLSLKKEQLSTTTRLAVLQNHQLTSELQFQSKQSQKLIFQNEQLLKKVTNLQKDLQIHKEIQDELAKRSHYSRGIIKKLTTKIAELQDELASSKTNTGQKKVILTQTNQVNQNQVDKKQEMIKALDKSLEFTEKKYIKLQTDYELSFNQNKDLKKKLQQYEKKHEEMLGLLLRYYEQIINGQIQVKDQQFVYDFKAMRKKTVQNWDTQEIRLVVLILLNQISSLINKKNLGIPTINKTSLSIADDDQIQKIKFPRISQHSAIGKLQTKKLKDLPINVASKVVGSHVREWGRTVHTNSVSVLSRKFKVYDK